MTALDTLRQHIDKQWPSKVNELASLSQAIGMEARPHPRAALTEQHRILAAQIDEISITRQLTPKAEARVSQWTGHGRLSTQAVAECEQRAAARIAQLEARACKHGVAERDEEVQEWLFGAKWLRGDVGGDRPGAVIVLARELNVERLMPIPTCDEMRQQAEADLVPHVERLRSVVDAWTAGAATVRNTATSDVTLPAVEGDVTITVRERQRSAT